MLSRRNKKNSSPRWLHTYPGQTRALTRPQVAKNSWCFSSPDSPPETRRAHKSAGVRDAQSRAKNSQECPSKMHAQNVPRFLKWFPILRLILLQLRTREQSRQARSSPSSILGAGSQVFIVEVSPMILTVLVNSSVFPICKDGRSVLEEVDLVNIVQCVHHTKKPTSWKL